MRHLRDDHPGRNSHSLVFVRELEDGMQGRCCSVDDGACDQIRCCCVLPSSVVEGWASPSKLFPLTEDRGVVSVDTRVSIGSLSNACKVKGKEY